MRSRFSAKGNGANAFEDSDWARTASPPPDAPSSPEDIAADSLWLSLSIIKATQLLLHITQVSNCPLSLNAHSKPSTPNSTPLLLHLDFSSFNPNWQGSSSQADTSSFRPPALSQSSQKWKIRPLSPLVFSYTFQRTFQPLLPTPKIRLPALGPSLLNSKNNTKNNDNSFFRPPGSLQSHRSKTKCSLLALKSPSASQCTFQLSTPNEASSTLRCCPSYQIGRTLQHKTQARFVHLLHDNRHKSEKCVHLHLLISLGPFSAHSNTETRPSALDSPLLITKNNDNSSEFRPPGSPQSQRSTTKWSLLA